MRIRIHHALLWLAAPLALVALVAGVAAASAPAAPGLKEAVEAAWQRQPQAQAAQARIDALNARRTAAEALLPAPPAIALTHETDQVDRNLGSRSFAGELSLPLWLPGQKDRLKAAIDTERGAYDANLAVARLRVAGEVRESYWQARAATAEMNQVTAALEGLAMLEADVARRVKAGELARVDGNRAEAETQFQRIALAQAEAHRHRALQQFRALTGLAQVPPEDEPRWPGAAPAAGAHPVQEADARASQSARARLNQAAADTRDAPEIGIGTTRQRGDFTKPWEQLVLLRVRIPFGGDNRNLPRISAANAELAETLAARAQSAARIDAEAASAEREMQAALGVVPLAEARLALARDTHELVARGFKAGEFDLTTRLRAERELRDAELTRSRAVIESGRANSRLKQAYGVLP